MKLSDLSEFDVVVTASAIGFVSGHNGDDYERTSVSSEALIQCSSNEEMKQVISGLKDEPFEKDLLSQVEEIFSSEVSDGGEAELDEFSMGVNSLPNFLGKFQTIPASDMLPPSLETAQENGLKSSI